MSLQADINWIQSELNFVKDPELIRAFKSLLKYRKNKVEAQDWWLNTDEKDKEDIEEGLNQLDKGDFISHDEVMKNPRKWS